MFYEFPGGKLFYKVTGKGTPLLIVHGFAVDHSMMEAFLEPVLGRSELWKRVYVDLPGMGKSDSLPLDKYADDACALLSRFMEDTFPGEPYGLVSHSFGGYITRHLIYSHPGRIIGAFFAAPVIYPMINERTLPPREQRFRDKSLESRYPEDYESYSRTAVIESEYGIKMYLQYIKPVLERQNRANLKFYQKSGYSCSVDINRLKKPFRSPCVFLTGRQDEIVGTEDTLVLQKDYPCADFIQMDDAGHNLFFEQKDFFEQILQHWLNRMAEQASRK